MTFEGRLFDVEDSSSLRCLLYIMAHSPAFVESGELARCFVKRRRIAGAQEVENRSEGFRTTLHLNVGIKDPDGRIDSAETAARIDANKRITTLKAIRSAIESGQFELANEYAARMEINDVTVEGIDREIQTVMAVRKEYRRSEPTDVHRDRTAIQHKVTKALDMIRKKCPPLASHLDLALRTGSSCAYEPNRDAARRNLKWILPSPSALAAPPD
jgi:hypothetical protein